LKARGKVYLGVELEMIYLGTSKGRRSRHRNLYRRRMCELGKYPRHEAQIFEVFLRVRLVLTST